MTIIEKYYNSGKITVQLDFTRTVARTKQPDEQSNCDVWEFGFESEKECQDYMKVTFGNEKYKRLPDITEN